MGTFEPDEFILHQENAFATDFLGCNGAGLVYKETADSIYNKILRRVFPGAVICLHDGRGENGAPGRTIEALKKAIPMLKAQGYEFRRIEEKYETAGRSEIS